jgi:RNA polymerase sigma factor (sigma-70 family)
LVEHYQGRLIAEAVGVFDLVQEDAEEIVSDVLMTVVEKIHDFTFKRGDADFHVWVMAIFKNRVRDHVRHRALVEGLEQHFEESSLDDEEGYTKAEFEVVREIVRQYQDSLAAERPESSRDGKAAVLHEIADVLDSMESWERVLLRCRALDVPYEDISVYTDKPVRQLKVYHARVKKKFVRLLLQRSPHLSKQLTDALKS